MGQNPTSQETRKNPARKERRRKSPSGGAERKFLSLKLYDELLFTVVKTYHPTEFLKEFDTHYEFLIQDLKNSLKSSLLSISNGYNRYYSNEKASATRRPAGRSPTRSPFCCFLRSWVYSTARTRSPCAWSSRAP